MRFIRKNKWRRICLFKINKNDFHVFACCYCRLFSDFNSKDAPDLLTAISRRHFRIQRVHARADQTCAKDAILTCLEKCPFLCKNPTVERKMQIVNGKNFENVSRRKLHGFYRERSVTRQRLTYEKNAARSQRHENE